MMTVKRMAPALLGLLLGSCGGGDGGGSGGVPIVSVPTTPTPSPSSSPPPSPPPAPTYSYQPVNDLNRDQNFTAFGARLDLTIPGPNREGIGRATVDPEATDIGFDLTAATGRYRARYKGDEIDVMPERTSATSTLLFSDRGITLVRFQFLPTYAGALTWHDGRTISADTPDAVIRSRWMVFGARTIVADLPVSGSINYVLGGGWSGNPIKVGFQTPDTTGGTVTINWSTRVVTGTITYQPMHPSGSAGSSFNIPTTTYSFTGTIAADGRIAGTLDLGGVTGPIEGSVYGPRAVDIGLVFRASYPERDVVGVSVGRTE